MLINATRLTSGAQVLLIDEFFPRDLNDALLQLVDAFAVDNPAWRNPPEFNGRPRYVYAGTAPVVDQLKQYLTSEELNKELEAHTGRPVRLIDLQIWVDLPGFGRLTPHVEAWGDYLSQIYITRQHDPDNGTTIYTDQRRILYQLPYRNNFGWFFDQCQLVWHGRKSDVAAGLTRASVMIWYNAA